MKNVLKKIQIFSLVALIGFGVMSITNKNLFQHVAGNQYVLSRYFSNRKFVQSTQGKKLKGTATAITLPSNMQGSANWSGYVVTPTSNSGYTSISGSWTIPNISTNQRNGLGAQWIGLGGVSSSDLLQMGTIEQIENGQPMAEIFWEQLPAVAQNVISVPIGSTINVNISEASNSIWNLTFTINSSDKQVQSQTISTTLDSSYDQGIGTSAEWISEDPSNGNGQLVPLANMGTVTYQAAMVNNQKLNASGNNVQSVAMVSSNKTIMVAPLSLEQNGESFTTTSVNQTSAHEIGGTSQLFRKNVRIGDWNTVLTIQDSYNKLKLICYRCLLKGKRECSKNLQQPPLL